ncbi:tail fiber assembly protein [Enterobacter huaxiensis]|uniref:tail fiber assembly protein n=1 Tax=Enterobacter huaxiensis TaxID=2494702 RepID=UPI0021757FC3|nr:tail fiber assembly protein [Enterobacter huaxiensis]MCS5452486.1 tail fiber assembly protein [Enterobacter huaxiensis]
MKIVKIIRWLDADGIGFRDITSGKATGEIIKDIGALIPVHGSLAGGYALQNAPLALYLKAEQAKIYFSDPQNAMQRLDPGSEGLTLFIFEAEIAGMEYFFHPQTFEAYPFLKKYIPFKIVGQETNKTQLIPNVDFSAINEEAFKNALEDANSVIVPIDDVIDLNIASNTQKQLWHNWKNYRANLYSLDHHSNLPIAWPLPPTK